MKVYSGRETRETHRQTKTGSAMKAVCTPFQVHVLLGKAIQPPRAEFEATGLTH